MSDTGMQTEPRSGSIALGGYPWLARMIDKARLDALNALEPLDLEYPCPMDQRLLNQLKIDATTFQSIVMASENDRQILEGLVKQGVQGIALPD